jgi:hypothetical protein
LFTLARTGYVSPSNYANTYGPITDEGTYTFRITVMAKLPDGRP